MSNTAHAAKQIDIAFRYAEKTDRQLRAIRANNAPGSTAALCNKEAAQVYHRAAYAELEARRAFRSALAA